MSTLTSIQKHEAKVATVPRPHFGSKEELKHLHQAPLIGYLSIGLGSAADHACGSAGRSLT